MSSEFSSYCAPHPSTKFSEHFFNNIVFKDVSTLVLPKILRLDSLHSWTWLKPPHDEPLFVAVAETDFVPHFEDYKDIMCGMEEAHSEGARGVLLELYTPNGVKSMHVHFSMLRIFTAINNHSSHIVLAQALIHRLTETSLLPTPMLEMLQNDRIMSSVSGFSTSAEMQLWEFGTLTGEHWLRDLMLNARGEFMYFKHIALDSLRQPHFLPLATNFFEEAEALWHCVPRLYSPNLIDLRSRLHRSNFHGFGFDVCRNGHWSGYTYTRSSALHLRDTLDAPPNRIVLDIINWVLEGLDFPVVEDIKMVPGPQQPAGSGSCGVSSKTFVERSLDPTCLAWTPARAQTVRDTWLRDLVVYHLSSVSRGGIADWTTPASGSPGLQHNPPNSGIPEAAVFYQDYTCLDIELSHPIFVFLQHNLKDVGDVPPPKSVHLLPPLELRAKQFTPVSQLAGFNPFERIPGGPRGYQSGLFSGIKGESEEVIDLTHLPVTPVRAHKHTHVRSSSIIEVSDSTGSPYQSGFSSASDSDTTFPPPSEILSLPAKRSKWIDTQKPSRKTHADSPIIISDSPIIIKTSPIAPKIKATSSTASWETKPSRSDKGVRSEKPSGAPCVGTIFETFGDTQRIICEYEQRRGNKFRIGQSKKRPSDGQVKKITLRCHAYGTHVPTHRPDIDPRDHRRGKTIKTGCMAHYNLLVVPGTPLWQLSLATYEHNHGRNLAVGAHAPRPASKAQRKIIESYAVKPSFSRRQIKTVLTEEHPGHDLDSRQISNIINDARARSRQDIEQLGGDFAAILNNLQQKIAGGEAWTYSLKLDDAGKVEGLWWQSPEQAALCRRYADILVNDNTANCNQYGYPINIGIVIDNFGNSRNIWYAFQGREDSTMHSWVLQNHLDAAGCHPNIFVSDRDPALIAVVRKKMPTTYHLYCLNHLDGSVETNVRPLIPDRWDEFQGDFWTTYLSVSPEVFEGNWKRLIAKYPPTQSYLDAELYSCRDHWAHAWTSQEFTAGIRTNGRVECENRVNKALGGPKRTAFDLYTLLNERTAEQSSKEMTRVREATRKQHDTNLEILFAQPLKLLRQYIGPFALQKTYREMGESVFYRAEVLQLPDGHRTWSEYAINAEEVVHFEWKDGEEKHMRNDFTNDNSLISTAFLIRLVTGRGLKIQQLLRIVNLGTGSVHVVALLDSDRYVCNCCMGSNLGVNCRHYYCALSSIKGMAFHPASIQKRWWQDPNIDASSISPVTLTHAVPEKQLRLHARPLPISSIANPLERANVPISSLPTHTINSRTVYHEAHAALKPLLNGIQTQEQLTALLANINAVGASGPSREQAPMVQDPPIIQHKGRPRSAHITSGIEGLSCGGGRTKCGAKRRNPTGEERPRLATPPDPLQPNPATQSPARQRRRRNRCGLCGEEGHDRRRCYDITRERQEEQERQRHGGKHAENEGHEE